MLIMPESAWASTELEKVPILSELPSTLTHLIIGSFGIHAAGWSNRCYYIKEKIPWDYYDKRHTVPLTEHPLCAGYDGSDRLFFSVTPPISASTNSRPRWLIAGVGAFVPYICSELFCHSAPDDIYRECAILALVNDRWFRAPHFKQLMALAGTAPCTTMASSSIVHFLLLCPIF
jgi:apolipoprotein N-acyltransferase